LQCGWTPTGKRRRERGRLRWQGIGDDHYYLAVAVVGRALFRVAADADFEAEDFAVIAEAVE